MRNTTDPLESMNCQQTTKNSHTWWKILNNLTRIKMTNDTTRHKRFKHLSFRKLTNEKQHTKINKPYYDNNQETNHKIKFNSS